MRTYVQSGGRLSYAEPVDELRLETRDLDDGIGQTLLVAPAGPVRGSNGEFFRAEVDRLIDEEGACSLVLDFGEVESIDSSGAGYLLNVHDRLEARGGKLALLNLSPGVRIVIDSIGLTSFFSICQTLEDALDEVGA